MATGPSTYCMSASRPLPTMLRSRVVPASSFSPRLWTRTKHPLPRLTCFFLLASETSRLTSPSRTESTFSLLFPSRVDTDGGQPGSLAMPVVVTEEETPVLHQELHRSKRGGRSSASATLPWVDPSLRYANVMWFKGCYNAEIICGENEPEDSIVRRFRQAVSKAGVIRECFRRRYRESAHDTIKRKQKQASFERRRLKLFSPSGAWSLSKEGRKPNGVSSKKKKKKSSSKQSVQQYLDQAKKTSMEAVSVDGDDDFWGYPDDEEPVPTRGTK